MNKRVALHNLHIVDPGPGPMAQTLLGIDFHNVTAAAADFDIVIHPSDFERGAIALLLPKVQIRTLLDVQTIRLPTDAKLGTWNLPSVHTLSTVEATHVINLANVALPTRLQAVDLSQAYRFNPGRLSQLRGISIPAGGMLQGTLVVSHKMDMPLAAPPRIDVV